MLPECSECKLSRKLAPVIKCQSCLNYVNERKEEYEEKDGIGIFYRYTNEDNSVQICNSCFTKDAKTTTKITVNISALTSLTVKKNEFVKTKNLATQPEPIVACRECSRTFHRICVRSVALIGRFQSDYVCIDCRPYDLDWRKKNEALEKHTKVKDLPQTDLSIFIEDRVNAMLPFGTKYTFIRVLSCVDKTYGLDSCLREFLQKYYDVPKEFKYRNRLLACFQEVEHGDSAMFFVVYFQEYGSECPEPNRNTICVAMLDSTKIFEPRTLRTKLYYFVLLTYFKYMKGQGFENAYIWSCPPLTPETEYVFQRRPGKQDYQTPHPVKCTRLRVWYEQMMKAGQHMRIIEEFKTLYDWLDPKTGEDEFFKKFPLFQDDHWPSTLVEIVNKVKTLGPPKKKKKANNSNQKNKRKRKSNANCGNRNSDEQNDETETYSNVFKELKIALRNRKEIENFNYIRLGAEKGEISRNFGRSDPTISSRLMNSRENLINCFVFNKLEFQNIRKAVYATKTILLQRFMEAPHTICNGCCDPIEFRGNTPQDNIPICNRDQAKEDFKEIITPSNNMLPEKNSRRLFSFNHMYEAESGAFKNGDETSEEKRLKFLDMCAHVQETELQQICLSDLLENLKALFSSLR